MLRRAEAADWGINVDLVAGVGAPIMRYFHNSVADQEGVPKMAS